MVEFPNAKDRMMFIDITPTGQTRTYERVGVGFDTATPSSNTNTKSTQWISDQNATTSITSKSIQRAISGSRAVGDPFNDYFCGLFDKIGAETQSTMVIVNAWEEVAETPGSYNAVKYDVVLDCTNDGGGAATDGLPIDGVIYINGDPVSGTFVLDTKTFTEA